MLTIWELKRKADSQKNGQNLLSPARIRVQKELAELELPPGMELDFPNVNDLLTFKLSYKPPEGAYKGGHFLFSWEISEQYPIHPPRVRLLQKIYHPNIDLHGAICLNLLREDWKPVLGIAHIAIGIQFLFLEPNPIDPLNKEAAASLLKNKHNFELEVRTAMEGGVIKTESFDKVV